MNQALLLPAEALQAPADLDPIRIAPPMRSEAFYEDLEPAPAPAPWPGAPVAPMAAGRARPGAHRSALLVAAIAAGAVLTGAVNVILALPV